MADTPSVRLQHAPPPDTGAAAGRAVPCEEIAFVPDGTAYGVRALPVTW
ncbi:hypothetical protein ACWGNE_14480 [Streptomyces xiamenensis]